METQSIPVDRSMILPDTTQWRFRFEIKSETSDRIYVISQNIKLKHWGCSCMAWRRYRKCKHLTDVGLPCFEVPYEAQLEAH